MEHYACMVTLLGRVGRLEEAYNMIKRMPFEPNAKSSRSTINRRQTSRHAVEMDVVRPRKVQCEEIELGDKDDDSVLTSLFGVIKRCFVDRIDRKAYENVAGNLILREISGIGFNGPFLGDKGQYLLSSLAPPKVDLVVSSITKRFFLTNDVESLMTRLLSSDMDLFGLRLRRPNSNLDSSKEFQLRCDSVICTIIYPLLLDLRDIFADLPSMSRALALAQKMLFDVNRGEVMDTEVIYEAYTFQIDKSQAFLARSLQSQAKKIKTVVAVVDARYLPRLQKYWNTSIPEKFKDFIGESVTSCEDDGETSNHMNKKRFFSNKPVVAVGVEATAVLRASSLTKLLPASTFMKAVAHSVITSIEKTSFSTMRTAFYERMRKRRVRTVCVQPWATNLRRIAWNLSEWLTLGVQNKVQCEEFELGDKGDDSVPTSLFGVIKRYFIDRIDKKSYENAVGNLILREIFGLVLMVLFWLRIAYENVAGNLILREIFGIGFNGLFWAAKRAAKEIG
ncbi:uncharacterized protein LOC116140608 [Pistacia vera]|uniref:uncharacterized protein LOC116140608 n=1 Tax=Pistacia vera TaxID=55513 RepID=UPI001263CCE2|nr:uncharacterized protein LOC116140608 [Pistacia vera]